MPALPFPKYGLENLYLFPYFQTREAYEQITGQEAPPWNPNRAPKGWFDPKAAQSTRRTIIYEHVLAVNDDNGKPLAGPDGKPFLDILALSREIASTVNIPPKGPGVTNLPGADVPEIPCPLRPLAEGEELAWDFGGIVVVRNKELYENLEHGFTARDRALLRSIAQKLGITL